MDGREGREEEDASKSTNPNQRRIDFFEEGGEMDQHSGVRVALVARDMHWRTTTVKSAISLPLINRATLPIELMVTCIRPTALKLRTVNTCDEKLKEILSI